MHVSVLESIDSVTAAEWNALCGNRQPFLRHEFLAALEHTGCVGEQSGWIPSHLAAYGDSGDLVGAVPMYRKFNSYGEFVFDWSWADAYQRAGLPYYPKLVVAAPYTPATGPRLLIAESPQREDIANALIATALDVGSRNELSSLHWLFTTEEDTQRLERHGLMRRMGVQFHWQNQGYRDFDDFLSRLSAQKRKKLQRERRHVRDAKLKLQVVHGNEATDAQLQAMYDFYQSIYQRKWGFPTLNLAFFQQIAATMGESVVMVLAYDDGKAVAGAFNLRGEDCLYGRYWGCSSNYHSLHFEACYYQGIEYCIRNGLKRFEPGAQGEHKISRGFLPTPTWSAHWIADERFRTVIGQFLEHESAAIRENIQELSTHSPYKETDEKAPSSDALEQKASLR